MIPNDIGLTFSTNERRGIRVNIPSINKEAKMKYTTQYDNSFRIRASKLWNSIPPELTRKTTMESFKPALNRFLQSFPDRPPIQGCSSRNSILDYNRNERGCWQVFQE